MKNVLYIEREGVQQPAYLWMKNGDCGGDGPADKEGKIVGYYRKSDSAPIQTCEFCHRPYSEHGYIPDGEHFNYNEHYKRFTREYQGMVCPGSWLLKLSPHPIGEKWQIVEPLVFRKLVWHEKAIDANPIYATNVHLQNLLLCVKPMVVMQSSIQELIDKVTINFNTLHELNINASVGEIELTLTTYADDGTVESTITL